MRDARPPVRASRTDTWPSRSAVASRELEPSGAYATDMTKFDASPPTAFLWDAALVPASTSQTLTVPFCVPEHT